MSNENGHGLEKLTKALANYFPHEDAGNLAILLSTGCRRDSLRYEEIDLEDDLKPDVILLAYRERLLVPLKSLSGSAWQDKVFSFADGEFYCLPRLVKSLVIEAEKTGLWDRDTALREVLEEAGDRDVERTLEFLEYIIGLAANYRTQIKEMQAVNSEFDFRLDIHDMLDHFIRCGIMSPLTRVSLLDGSPTYEINPSLRWDIDNG
ncbi:MAG: hypothetical protein R6U37_01930 [Dehalococcoidia bacterium]